MSMCAMDGTRLRAFPVRLLRLFCTDHALCLSACNTALAAQIPRHQCKRLLSKQPEESKRPRRLRHYRLEAPSARSHLPGSRFLSLLSSSVIRGRAQTRPWTGSAHSKAGLLLLSADSPTSASTWVWQPGTAYTLLGANAWFSHRPKMSEICARRPSASIRARDSRLGPALLTTAISPSRTQSAPSQTQGYLHPPVGPPCQSACRSPGLRAICAHAH